MCFLMWTHTQVLFWGHWYHCFGFLVMSPLCFKARVGSALFAFVGADPLLLLHLLTFWRTHVLFWGHWYPCFGFLVTSPLGFKARVGSALFTIFAEVNVMYIPQDPPLVLHLPTSWRPACSRSLPHMHVQRWDLAQIRTCNLLTS